MNGRAFGEYDFTFKLLVLDRDAICGLVGEVLVTMWLHMLEAAAIKNVEVLTRHPTKCARTTRLEAYVKVAPDSGSTYFLWDFSFTSASSRLQSLPCSKRSAGSASQNFLMTAYFALAISSWSKYHTQNYFALANVIHGLKMQSIIFLYHMYVLEDDFD